VADRKIKRHFNWLDIQPDQKLDAQSGWVKMDVRWVATKESCGTEFAVMGRTIFRPRLEGQSSKHDLHTHPNAEEIIHIIRGTGRGLSGTEWFDLKPGDVLYVPKGEDHIVENTSDVEPLEVIFVYAPATNLSEAGYHHKGSKK
jgi:mannose-6-phosphate isomerase-like protein (cupin superfamily)